MKNFKLKKSRGISLPLSLFVLLGLTVSSATLFLTSESSVEVAGNVGLRNITAQANDSTVSTAITWLLDNQPSLKNSNSGAGYVSSYPLSDIDYDNESSWAVSKTAATDSLGNSSRYIIYRLCSQADTAFNGSVSGVYNVCATKTNTSASNNGNSAGFGSYNFTAQPTLFYKIVVQTRGPKSSKTTTSTVVGLTAS